jgi:hypothetical protein
VGSLQWPQVPHIIYAWYVEKNVMAYYKEYFNWRAGLAKLFLEERKTRTEID